MKVPTKDILSRQEELQKTKYRHEILVKGKDLEACRNRVLRFFGNYQLVRYSSVSILEGESLPALNSGFQARLRNAILKNRQILNELISELRGEGVVLLKDLAEMPEGYKTKMLHVITHLLDGFFGIDSYFYNLEEDSHWISEKLRKRIADAPSAYWLLSVEAEI